MRNYYFVLFSCLVSTLSSGQSLYFPGGFTSSGIGTSNVSGKIGVGTSTPSENLQVVRTLAIGNFTTGYHAGLRIEYVDDGSGTMTFMHQRWGGDFYFKRGDANGERTQCYFGGSYNHRLDIYDGNNQFKVSLRSCGDSDFNGELRRNEQAFAGRTLCATNDGRRDQTW